MYQYGNPVNDFYFRNSQLNFPPQNIPQLKTFIVTSINEAKSAMIDPLSTNIFVDTSNGKIYLKKIGNNGQQQFLIYTTDEEVPTDPMAEINTRLTKIEEIIGRLNNDKSIPINDQSTTVSQQPTSSPVQSNETAEPSGFSEAPRNDFWQKR